MTTVNSANANKLLQVALFTAANRKRSFVNMLTDNAPKTAQPDKLKNQTSFGAPVVRVSDLTKVAGDEVDMQIVHKLSKRPTMGDKKLEGRGENLAFASFGLKINQGRHLVDAGGKMTQKRTKHDLLKTARTLLGTYFNDLQDQGAICHLAGARGDFFADDIILPLASDPEFAEIMVNDIMPPTYGRHFFGGDATTFEGLDSSDLFSLEAVDNLSLFLSEMAHPLQPIKLAGDDMAEESPLYVLEISPRQWNDWYTSTSGKDWQSMIASAMSRSKGFNHPLFKGECAMWRNILVRQYGGMPVRFYEGSTVDVSNNDAKATVSQKTAGTNIDRGILLGAQALANAYGVGEQGAHFGMKEVSTDHDNAKEVSISWINGLKKIRFAEKNGKVQDHGVIVLDTAVKL
jgi:N4-gp56 family major capsid protein